MKDPCMLLALNKRRADEVLILILKKKSTDFKFSFVAVTRHHSQKSKKSQPSVLLFGCLDLLVFIWIGN
jgi:hypothetical protein